MRRGIRGTDARAWSLQARVVAFLAGALASMLLLAGVYAGQVNARAREEAQTSNAMVCQQLASSINEWLISIRQIANTLSYSTYAERYLTSGDMKTRMASNMALELIASYALSADSRIVEIALVDVDGDSRRFGNSQTTPWFKSLRAFQDRYPELRDFSFTRPFFTEFVNLPDGGGLYALYASPIYSVRDNTVRVGSCLVLCDGRGIRGGMEMALPAQGAEMMLESGNGAMFRISSPGTSGRERVSATVPVTGWEISMRYPYTSVLFRNQGFDGLVAVLLFGMAGMVVLFFFTLQWGLAQPVKRLVRGIEGIPDKPGERVALPAARELRSIARSVNGMLDELDASAEVRIEQQRQLYAEQLVAERAQVDALRSQMNPHFLYNTLACVGSMGRAYGIQEIARIVESMTVILRYSIKSPRFVDLAEELEIVGHYLNICEIRFDGRFGVEMDVEAEGVRVPSMTLQPLVENAVFHGLEPKVGRGKLWIRARQADGEICVEVRDDGVGLGEARLGEIREALEKQEGLGDGVRGSIGLVNIQRRVQILFGRAYGLSIESALDAGTCVRLRMPTVADAWEGGR